ncbi:hypothetical protein ACJJTC_003284 [Scirpophaga incertulas]
MPTPHFTPADTNARIRIDAIITSADLQEEEEAAARSAQAAAQRVCEALKEFEARLPETHSQYKTIHTRIVQLQAAGARRRLAGALRDHHAALAALRDDRRLLLRKQIHLSTYRDLWLPYTVLRASTHVTETRTMPAAAAQADTPQNPHNAGCCCASRYTSVRTATSGCRTRCCVLVHTSQKPAQSRLLLRKQIHLSTYRDLWLPYTVLRASTHVTETRTMPAAAAQADTPQYTSVRTATSGCRTRCCVLVHTSQKPAQSRLLLRKQIHLSTYRDLWLPYTVLRASTHVTDTRTIPAAAAQADTPHCRTRCCVLVHTSQKPAQSRLLLRKQIHLSTYRDLWLPYTVLRASTHVTETRTIPAAAAQADAPQYVPRPLAAVHGAAC